MKKISEKICRGCNILLPLTKFQDLWGISKKTGERRHQGWKSKCRTCYGKIKKAKAKEKRQPGITLKAEFQAAKKKALATATGVLRFKTTALIIPSHSAQHVEVQTCMLCGAAYPPSTAYFSLAKAKGYKFSRVCKKCEPYKSLGAKGRWSAILHHLLVTEDLTLLEHGLKLFAKDAELSIYANEKIIRLPLHQALQMLKDQNFRCAICKLKPPGNMLHIDHCHKTAIIRGLLCPTCNFGLGMFKDNSENLQAAAAYLVDSYKA